MKNDRLSSCLGDIDDKFIDEAADYKKKSRRRGVYYLAAALAACVIIALAVQMRPSANISQRPDAPPAESSTNAEASGGIHIPAIARARPAPARPPDLIPCVVYDGAVYTLGEWLDDSSSLLGEYLGHGTGSLDEWSEESDYVELYGTMSCELYTVAGYDPDFRICCLGEDGSALLLERLNGITLDTGADLFDTRLHLAERMEDVSYLTHDDWNNAVYDFKPLGLDDDTVSAFLDELCAGEFVYTWETDHGIYDSTVQGHLFFFQSDGTTIELRLIEGGYVGYQGLGWYFVKMPGDVFDAVLAACA